MTETHAAPERRPVSTATTTGRDEPARVAALPGGRSARPCPSS